MHIATFLKAKQTFQSDKNGAPPAGEYSNSCFVPQITSLLGGMPLRNWALTTSRLDIYFPKRLSFGGNC